MHSSPFARRIATACPLLFAWGRWSNDVATFEFLSWQKNKQNIHIVNISAHNNNVHAFVTYTTGLSYM